MVKHTARNRRAGPGKVDSLNLETRRRGRQALRRAFEVSFRLYGRATGANLCGRPHRPTVSERVPGRALGEFQIADVEPQTRADPGADRNHVNIVVDERRHAKAADEIGRAINPAEAAKDRARRGQIIDKHHGAIAVRSGIETK